MIPAGVIPVFSLGQSYNNVLFKLAFHFAENGLKVWFISPETFGTKPRNLQIPEKEMLQQITFIYLSNYSDLIKHLSNVHIWHHVPNVIIVSKLEKYLLNSEENEFKGAFLATNLLDCAAVCARKDGKKTFLLVTSEADRNLVKFTDLYFENCPKQADDEAFFVHIVEKFT